MENRNGRKTTLPAPNPTLAVGSLHLRLDNGSSSTNMTGQVIRLMRATLAHAVRGRVQWPVLPSSCSSCVRVSASPHTAAVPPCAPPLLYPPAKRCPCPGMLQSLLETFVPSHCHGHTGHRHPTDICTHSACRSRQGCTCACVCVCACVLVQERINTE